MPYGSRRAVRVLKDLHETLGTKGFAFLLNRYTSREAVISGVEDGEEKTIIFRRDEFSIGVYTDVGTDVRSNERLIGEMKLQEDDIRRSSEGLISGNSLLFSSNLVKLGFKYMKENWISLVNERIGSKVAEEASSLSNERYRDITIEPFMGGDLTVYAYREDGTRIRLGDLGEGIQTYMVARTLHDLYKPQVLLWDDVEAHMNPLLLMRVAEWFSDLVDQGEQVVVTTHSLNAVRTIAGLDDRAKIYLTSLRDGVLRVRMLEIDEVEELQRAGTDVRMGEGLLL